MNAEQGARDLCWAINTASLVDGDGVAPTPAISFDAIDQAHLASFLSEQGSVHRVGRYFEQLIHYWLAHVRQVEVVATGLQLKDGKITVGEIDFLYRDEQGALTHCEASVKYFLCAPGTSPSEFPGPNARDNFEAKSTKLFEKQLPASEGRIDGIRSRHGLVKGLIFYRDGEPDVERPVRLAQDHQRGRWLRADELSTLRASEGVFAIATKPHWLAPQVDAELMEPDVMVARLKDHFMGPAHPVMVSERDRFGSEVARLCVVPGPWPNDSGRPR